MTFQDLQQQHQQLITAIAQLKAEGDIILNPPFWLDSTRNGQTNKTYYRQRWFDAKGGKQSVPLSKAAYEDTKAAIARGRALQALEDKRHQVSADLAHIKALAEQHGFLLPPQKSHDCAVQHSSDSNEWYTLPFWIDKVKGDFIDGAGYTSRVGFCVDSLLAIDPAKFVGCVLVIDEVVQVVRHLLTSSTCQKDGKRPVLLARLRELIQAARLVLVADADLDNKTLDYLQNLRGDQQPVFLVRNDYQAQGYPCTFMRLLMPVPPSLSCCKTSRGASGCLLPLTPRQRANN